MLIGHINEINTLRANLIGAAAGRPPDYFTAQMSLPAATEIVTTPETGSITGLDLNGLTFNGSQYINTGYKPTNNTKIDIVFMQEQYAAFLFGCRTSGGADAFAFINYSTSMYPQFGSFQAVVSPTDMSLNEKHRLVLSQDGAYIDDTAVKTFDTMNFTSTLDLYIGTRNQSGTLDSRMFVGAIYAVKIYESNVLQMALYPHNNGTENGLYDLVDSTFYPQSVRT